MIRWLYSRLLLSRLAYLPARICFMITDTDLEEAPRKLLDCTRWCRDISRNVSLVHGQTGQIRSLTYHVSTPDPTRIEHLIPVILEMAKIARLELHVGDKVRTEGEGMPVTIAIGKGGREEIAECFRRMALDHVLPEQVNESKIESYLTFQYTPDLVIKTGGNHLTDFLIWQSVYSELFFSDVNWRWFRKVDLLRAFRDYQDRMRRFGR
jgi:undecaprenyl diphosphate synthase